MRHDLIVRNGKIVTAEGVATACILVDDGRVSAVTPTYGGEKAEETIDAKGGLVLPGIIDCHVHFRDPGATKKEDWRTGSRSAAAGGVSTVLDMPNTTPATTTRKALKEKRSIAEKKSLIDFGMHFGAAGGNRKDIETVSDVASVKFYLGSSTGPLLMDDPVVVEDYFRFLSDKGIPATVHAEDETMIRKRTDILSVKSRRPDDYGRARPREAAEKSVRDILAIQQRTGCQLHVCHVSTKEELTLLNNRPRNVSFEVTPHHLLLDEGDYKRLKSFGKVNPPLRTKSDRLTLWRALQDGVVDCVATDHAPHRQEEKEAGIWEAPAGLPGVETTLPLLLTHVHRRNLTFQRFVEVTAAGPARIFGLANKGAIAPGYDADLAIVDPAREWTVCADEMHSKCGWTPYEGFDVRGKVTHTLVRGHLVYEEGAFIKHKGKEVAYTRNLS